MCGIPAFSRGLSDFDTKHLITVDWVYALAFRTRESAARQFRKSWRCHLGRLAMGRVGPLDKRTAVLGYRAGMDNELGSSGLGSSD